MLSLKRTDRLAFLLVSVFTWTSIAQAGRVCPSGDLFIKILGQSVLLYDIRKTQPLQVAAIKKELESGSPDFILTDLELAIKGVQGGVPNRIGLDNSHVARPEVLDVLKSLGIHFLVASNNHSFDLGEKGIISTLDEMKARGFTYAGMGSNLESAAAAGVFLVTRVNKTVAVVGAVSAPALTLYGGSADSSHPGVNPLQLDLTSKELNPDQLQRNSESLRKARTQSDLLIAYHHNHFFEMKEGVADELKISQWWRKWAHQAIDEGADMYVSHGSTVLNGIEIYKGKPIFYGLGSFFFQTSKKPGAYAQDSWESVIVESCWDSKHSRMRLLRFKPVIMNDIGIGSPKEPLYYQTRGLPSVAKGKRGMVILNRLKKLSDAPITVQEDGAMGYVGKDAFLGNP